MLQYLIRRLLWSLLVLLCVAGFTFYLVHLIPGSPWENRTGQRAVLNVPVSPVIQALLDRRYGLDKPVWQQFVVYLVGGRQEDGEFHCGAICGDLGPSLRQYGRTIQEILFSAPETGTLWHSRFAYTMRLFGWVSLAILILGILPGVLSAVRRGSWLDRGVAVLSAISMAVPNFVLGLLALILFVSLGWISVRADWSDWRDWVLPVLILAISPAGMLSRITRSAVLEALQGDYVRTARSKGLPEIQILSVHIFKNALIPIISHLGPLLVEFIALSFVIESMFGFPGFGREYYQAIINLDYSMIMAVTLLYGVFVILVNLVADVLYGYIDPRIRVVE